MLQTEMCVNDDHFQKWFDQCFVPEVRLKDHNLTGSYM